MKYQGIQNLKQTMIDRKVVAIELEHHIRDSSSRNSTMIIDQTTTTKSIREGNRTSIINSTDIINTIDTKITNNRTKGNSTISININIVNIISSNSKLMIITLNKSIMISIRGINSSSLIHMMIISNK